MYVRNYDVAGFIYEDFIYKKSLYRYRLLLGGINNLTMVGQPLFW